MKKAAIAYVRFSSDRQKDGTSIERQTEIIEGYAQRNGLELVNTFTDEGFSASKGYHLSKGDLGRILTDVDAGKYRDYALIVEKLDRFSRLGIVQTQELTTRLHRGGVELHLAASSRIVRDLDDLPTAIMGAVESYGAKMYTDNLRSNIQKAKESRKTEAATSGWIITRRVPAWLKVVDRENIGNRIVKTGRIVEIPEKVAVVREAFRLAALGMGRKHIAHRLKDSCSESLNWLTRTLCDRAVLGEYHPAGRDPIIGYYPQIISQQEFDAAREQAEKKRRGEKYIGGNTNGNKSDNLFTSLVFDITDGDDRPMNFQAVRPSCYLRTSFKAGCDQRALPYNHFETSVLKFLEQADWHSIAGQTESDEVKAAKAQLATVLRDIDVTARQIVRLNDAMMAEDIDPSAIPVIGRNVAKCETKLEELTASRDALQSNVNTAQAKCAHLYDSETLIHLIQSNSPEANDIRLRLKTELRKRIARISVSFSKFGQNAIDGLVLISVEYVNGVLHQIGWKRGDSRIMLLPDVRPGEDVSGRVRVS
jgi:DNA invertase Pin-like site-specific DNA recombinase